MQSWAAIDLLGGRVVSLVKGDPSARMDWGIDPVGAARRWEQEGADGLHVVDLDRALGAAPNGKAVRAILEEVSIPVQVGGGIRSINDALQLLEMGAYRVVVGTLAYSTPDVLRDLVEKEGAKSVIVAIDYSGTNVLTHGWREEGGMDVFEAAHRIERMGIGTVIVTATERDGTARGPDFETYKRLKGATKMRILASGGIRSSEDVAKLGDLGLQGAILGRALYEGSIRMAELGKNAA